MSLSQIFLVLSLVILISVLYFQAEHTSWFLLSSVPSTNAICDKSMGESLFHVECELPIWFLYDASLNSWFLFLKFGQFVICTWGTACAFLVTNYYQMNKVLL